MYTLGTVLHISQHTHHCTIHEMYDYDWSKLVFIWILTTSSTRPPEGKEISIISL